LKAEAFPAPVEKKKRHTGKPEKKRTRHLQHVCKQWRVTLTSYHPAEPKESALAF